MTPEQASQTEGPDITNYWQYFELARDPFAMHVDESLYFVSPHWEELLDLLQYLCHYKNQLLVITAPNGAGKTALQDLLLNQLSDTVHVAKISGDPNFDIQRFIEFLSDAFALPWQPEQSAEQALDEQLQALQQKDKPCLLVVDNAHLLPNEIFEALLYLVGQQSEHQMRFHALLLGEPSLQNTLQKMMESNEEHLVHFSSLEAFSLPETQNYLNHRLSASGWSNDLPLTEEMMARIYRLSEGNPARINRIARRALLDMLMQDQQQGQTVLQRHKIKFLGGAVVLAIIVVLSIIMLRVSNDIKAANPVAAPKITLNGQVAAPLNGNADEQVNLPLPAASQPADPAKVAPANMNGQQADPKVASATDNTMPQPVVIDAETKNVANNMAAAPTQAAVPSLVPAIAPKSSTNALAANTTANDSTPTPVANAAANLADNDIAPTTQAAKPLKTAAVSKTSDDTKAAKASVNKGDYAIQLISLTDGKNIDKFIADHHLKGKVSVVKTKHQGKVTTIVLYGHYKTMHDAEQALTNLPADLQSAQPWPRKIPAVKHK